MCAERNIHTDEHIQRQPMCLNMYRKTQGASIQCLSQSTDSHTHTHTHTHNVYHRHGECHNGEDPVHKVLQENFGSGVRHDVHKEAEEEVGQVDPLQCNKRIAVVVAQHISLVLRASTTVQCKMLDCMRRCRHSILCCVESLWWEESYNYAKTNPTRP